MKRNLCEQGYYVARGLLNGWTVGNVMSDMTVLMARECDHLGAIQAFHRLGSLQSLLTSKEIIGGLTCLGFEQPTIPISPVVIVMSDEKKIEGGYHGLEPHQDWTSTQGSLDTVTVWVPLHDVAKDNFPLEVIPGSHLRGVWPGKRNGLYYEIDKSEYKDSDFVPLEVKQGDVVIMSGFTVHRTGVKDSKGLRIAASIRFDNSAEPSFIKRNYPCMYSRTLKQEWQDDNLPGAEEMKGVFGI